YLSHAYAEGHSDDAAYPGRDASHGPSNTCAVAIYPKLGKPELIFSSPLSSNCGSLLPLDTRQVLNLYLFWLRQNRNLKIFGLSIVSELLNNDIDRNGASDFSRRLFLPENP